MTESHHQTLTPTPGQISRGCHSVVDMLPDVVRAMLRELGVTHVVVHLDRYRAASDRSALDALDGVSWLHRTFGDDQARVFAVTP